MKLLIFHSALTIHTLLVFITFSSETKAHYLQPKFELPSSYNKERSPSQFGQPVEVIVSIFVEAINPIKASDMDFRMKLFMYQTWVDPRFNLSEELFMDSDHFVLPLEFINQIWKPDPNIANSKSSDIGQLTKQMQSVYIFRNNTVTYFINFFVTVACTFQFQFYPYDFQICPYFIESFSYDDTKIRYAWSKVNPFVINPKLLRMLQYAVTRPLRFTTETDIGERRFTRLVAFFRFDRLLGNHLIQTFAPCSLVISLSWFSFWLGLDAISARVSVLVTSFLTLVTQFSGLKLDFPPVAYIKAVDIWMAGSMVFIFGAFGEFVVVKILHSLTELEKKKIDQKQNGHHEIVQNMIKDDRSNSSTSTSLEGNYQESVSTPSESPPMKSSRKERFQLNKIAVPDDIFFEHFGNHSTSSGNSTTRKRGENKNEKIGRQSEDNDDDNRPGISKGKHHNHDFVEHQIFHYKLSLVWKDENGKKKTLWKEIDHFSKIVFPASFCFFSGIYWLTLFHFNKFNSWTK